MNQISPIQEIQTSVQVVPSTPLVHPERFADLLGIERGIVQGWISKGYVPTIKIGKYNLINLALIHQQCLSMGE